PSCESFRAAAPAAVRTRSHSCSTRSAGIGRRATQPSRVRRTTARPTATPPETLSPRSIRPGPRGAVGRPTCRRRPPPRGAALLVLVEPAGDQVFDGAGRFELVVAVDRQVDGRAVGGREEKDPEDRLAVDLLLVLPDSHGGSEPAGRVDELRRRTGVQPEA